MYIFLLPTRSCKRRTTERPDSRIVLEFIYEILSILGDYFNSAIMKDKFKKLRDIFKKY